VHSPLVIVALHMAGVVIAEIRGSGSVISAICSGSKIPSGRPVDEQRWERKISSRVPDGCRLRRVASALPHQEQAPVDESVCCKSEAPQQQLPAASQVDGIEPLEDIVLNEVSAVLCGAAALT
jgi:hypothetical protein